MVDDTGLRQKQIQKKEFFSLEWLETVAALAAWKPGKKKCKVRCEISKVPQKFYWL